MVFSAHAKRGRLTPSSLSLTGFRRKEFRGKLAIAITANFINRNSTAEAKVEEISGVAFIFNQKFFQDLKEETGETFASVPTSSCPYMLGYTEGHGGFTGSWDQGIHTERVKQRFLLMVISEQCSFKGFLMERSGCFT